ncbi:MAG: HAD family phosphatase [Alphaproteobacteria bacterium]|nr:HAD family phosphatase [Alphaproteobacteria bacterium]MCB9794421.1 HAD family phosphatase [Alphaproteobacteria bacterium]
MSAGRPRPLAELEGPIALRGVFCDIDDTLTVDGRLVPEAFMALAQLQAAGLRVIPITGRPGGWVDHIARCWPVDGVVGENGGLWFYRQGGRMLRRFLQPAEVRADNRARLDALAARILAAVPGTALASDQSYRDLDLAIDFCEDVPRLGEDAIDAIVAEFHAAGATCKVSSIHVNGWYGDFDKLTGCRRMLAELGEDLDAVVGEYAFFGDSANDEPMFSYFPLSIGVANVEGFLHRMQGWPKWITEGEGGHGFAEGVAHLLAQRA